MTKEAPTPNPGVLPLESNPEQLEAPRVEMSPEFTIGQSGVSLAEFKAMVSLVRERFEVAGIQPPVLEAVKGFMFSYLLRSDSSFEYATVNDDWAHMINVVKSDLWGKLDGPNSQLIVNSILDKVVKELKEFETAASAADARGVKKEIV
jgi:hypothetical protein